MDTQIAQTNFTYLQETADLKKNIELNFVQLGARLKKIRDEKLYKPNHENFEDYLNNDINIQKSTASRLITIVEVFVEKLEFRPAELTEYGGWSDIAEITPYCKDRETADNLLSELKVLTRPDMRKKLIELKTGLPMTECLHEEWDVVQICRKCKHMQKV